MSQDDREVKTGGAAGPARKQPGGPCGGGLVVVPSAFSVEETAGRLEAELRGRGIPLFAVFDHARNAQEADLELRPTRVLAFGSPKLGTLLMQEEQSLSNELPLRMALWEDGEGRSWIGYARARDRMRAYGLEGHPVVEKMDALLAALARAAGERH